MNDIKINIKPRLWPWLWRVLLDWMVIIVCIVSFYQWPTLLVFIISIIVIGTRQHAISILGHDGGHRLICRNRFMNDMFTGIFCFWLLGTPIEGYRKFHFQHHRKVGTEDDPERIHKKKIPQWQLPLNPAKVFSHLLLDFVGGALPHIGLLIYLTQPVRFFDLFGPILMNMAFILGCIFLQAEWVLILWYGAIFSSFWASFRMRVWTEHVGTDQTHIISASWWQKVLFLPHNTWCHHEHHENAAVPCWALPQLRDKSKEKDVLSLFKELSGFKTAH